MTSKTDNGIESPNALLELVALTENLQQSVDLTAGLSLVAKTALTLIPAEGATARVFDESGAKVLAIGCAGKRWHSCAAGKLSASQGLIGWVTQTACSVLVNDTEKDNRFVRRADQTETIGSVICSPFVAGAQTIGVLSVAHGETDALTKNHEDLLHVLANCSTPSIEIARLDQTIKTDTATVSYNRRYLNGRLDEELQRAHRHDRSLTIAVVDIDDFKPLNQKYGRFVCDHVLRTAEGRLRESMRLHDMLGRWGADEFMVIMPETDLNGARVVIDRLLSAIRDCPVPDPNEPSVEIAITASAGLAPLWVEDNVEDLLRRADETLLQAKGSGGDGYEPRDEDPDV